MSGSKVCPDRSLCTSQDIGFDESCAIYSGEACHFPCGNWHLDCLVDYIPLEVVKQITLNLELT